MGRNEQDNKGPSVIFNNSAIMQSVENEEVIETRPFWLKRRYLVVLMAFFGFFNVYSLRVNLSVAIVSMTEIKNITLGNGTIIQEQAFNWTSTQKGLILSSFFYGYITTQLIGGVIAAKIGGNRIFGIGIGMTAILTLLTPVAAKTHLYVLLAIRVIEGVFEGVTFPSIHSVWSRWAPPLERSRMASIAYAGNYAGTVIAMPASGLLAAAYGWESVFYVFGAIGVAWLILWMIIVRKCPENDRFIKEEEKRYIVSKLGNNHHSQTKHISPPWKAMLTSAPVWAIVASHCAENWGFYTLLTQLPTFLSNVFDFHLEKTGFLSAVPYLTMGLLLFVSGYMADWFQVKGYLTTTQVRRYFNCTAFLAQTIFMLLAAFLLHPVTSIVCITIAVGIGAFAWSGFAVNHLDIAPQYASILMGISNTFATVPGIVSPFLTGWIVEDGTVEKWKIIFYISAGIYLFGCVIYWFFASGEVQPWAQTHIQQTNKNNKTDVEKNNKPPPYAYTNEGIELKDE